MTFDWEKIFLNDLDWSYFLELLLRTICMFFTVLILLRLSGKKGVRQLSLFEVAIIISFGSAAGDPMFQEDVALIPSIIVLVVIIMVYRLITWMTMKSEKVESLFEGDPEYVIENGEFVLSHKSKQAFANDEFLSEMRQQNIEHLGQVRIAILETNGTVSFFFYEDDKVKPGMPVLPKEYSQMSENIPAKGDYACTYCGHVEHLHQPQTCSRCDCKTWVKAIDCKRIT